MIAIILFLSYGMLHVRAYTQGYEEEGTEVLIEGFDGPFLSTLVTRQPGDAEHPEFQIHIWRLISILLRLLVAIPLIAIAFVWLAFGFDSRLDLLKVYFAVSIFSAIGFSIAMIFLSSLSRISTDPEHVNSRLEIVMWLATLLAIFATAFVSAVYLIGFKDPGLRSVEFTDRSGEYALVAYQDGYWYVFDCNKRLLAIDNDDAGTSNLSAGNSNPCGYAPTSGWHKASRWVHGIKSSRDETTR